jgi:CDP-paratose 2-epimerase
VPRGERRRIIYHFAAQVAVTSSVERTDFECNALGTFNMLEAARRGGRRPIFVFTSTNKVYGGMEELATVERSSRCEYEALPYGCSKGAADQYVRDYASTICRPSVSG